jgi:AcrR family transcriptional regulator
MLGVAVADRRTRERAARRQLITSTARAIAEREGWDAITTRRLAAEIEYSQPVIYKHFASMDEVVDAVALEGFGELAQVLARARTAGDAKGSLGRVAHAYSTFAAENPTLYDAMFTRPTRLHFAAEDTPAEMSAGFSELRQAVATVAADQDVDTLTEIVWAGLHGLTTLGRGGRLRPGLDAERIELLVSEFARGTARRPHSPARQRVRG